MQHHYDLAIAVLNAITGKTDSVRVEVIFRHGVYDYELEQWAKEHIQGEYDKLAMESPGSHPAGTVTMTKVTTLAYWTTF